MKSTRDKQINIRKEGRTCITPVNSLVNMNSGNSQGKKKIKSSFMAKPREYKP